MTQDISVYISKTISGPNILGYTLELGTTEVCDRCKTTIQIYGIKPLQLKIFDVSYLFLYLAENLWCLFDIVYKVVYRSKLVTSIYIHHN